jgi:hypothetical protein
MADETGAETAAPAVTEVASPDLGSEEVGGSEEVTTGSPETYTVTVDGEELQVTLQEALQGYQRQSDYTRKTQEVASQRETLDSAARLAAALERDPQRTLEVLAQAYGVSLGQAAEIAAETIEEDPDPEEARLRSFESFMQQQQEREAQAALDTKFVALHQKYGDFEEPEFIEFALERGLTDLDTAFSAWAFERLTTSKSRREAADREVEQRKAGAPPVAGGRGVAAGAVTEGAAPPTNIRDALRAALRQHGASI